MYKPYPVAEILLFCVKGQDSKRVVSAGIEVDSVLISSDTLNHYYCTIYAILTYNTSSRKRITSETKYIFLKPLTRFSEYHIALHLSKKASKTWS